MNERMGDKQGRDLAGWKQQHTTPTDMALRSAKERGIAFMQGLGVG